MANFNIDNNSRRELIFSKERIEKDELLEDGSADLYDIIKFCCAIKENPESPNFKEWSRKESNSDLSSLVYGFKSNENQNFGENEKKILSYAQRAQIYAMTAITSITSEDSERAVWNAVRAQKYVSHIQEILSYRPELKNIRKPMEELRRENKSVNKDAKANDLLDEFEELIQQFDSYGAFRRLAAKRLGVPVIRVTIQEINEVTKLVHQAYADFPNRLKKH